MHSPSYSQVNHGRQLLRIGFLFTALSIHRPFYSQPFLFTALTIHSASYSQVNHGCQLLRIGYAAELSQCYAGNNLGDRCEQMVVKSCGEYIYIYIDIDIVNPT